MRPVFKSPEFGLALALVVVALGGFWQWRRGRALEPDIAAAQSSLTQLHDEVAETKRTLSAERAAKAREERAASARFPRGIRLPESMRENLEKNPELARAAYTPVLREQFRIIYDDPRVTAEQRMEFENVLVSLGPLLDAFLLSTRRSEDAPSGALPSLPESFTLEVQEELRIRCGEDVAARFLEAMLTREIRRDVERLVVAGFQAGSPINGTQQRQLEEVFAAAGAEPLRAGRMPMTHQLNWEMIMARAPGILAPAQLRALTAMRAKVEFDREYEKVARFAPLDPLPEPEK